jgi:hypothetical protein
MGLDTVLNTTRTRPSGRSVTSTLPIATRWGPEFDVPAQRRYGAYEAMLEGASLDAVLVGTPHTLHYPRVVAALERGWHVYCEKPLTTDLGRARDLTARAERSDRRTCSRGRTGGGSRGFRPRPGSGYFPAGRGRSVPRERRPFPGRSRSKSVATDPGPLGRVGGAYRRSLESAPSRAPTGVPEAPAGGPISGNNAIVGRRFRLQAG